MQKVQCFAAHRGSWITLAICDGIPAAQRDITNRVRHAMIVLPMRIVPLYG